MLNKLFFLLTGCVLVITANCQVNKNTADTADSTIKTAVGNIDLPAPYATPSVRNNSRVIGWLEGKTPIAPVGFKVTLFADGLDNPRWMYVAPNGDIFVSEANTISDGFAKTSDTRTKSKSNNSILLLRDGDHDGIPELKKVFLTGLNRPFGILIMNNQFYVANTDGILVFPYETGQTEMMATGKKILDLPAGGIIITGQGIYFPVVTGRKFT